MNITYTSDKTCLHFAEFIIIYPIMIGEFKQNICHKKKNYLRY